MSERDEIKKAHVLISQGKEEEAQKILWAVYSSKDPMVRIDALLALQVVLNDLTENKKLLEITNVGIELATKVGRQDVLAYLMGKKCMYMLNGLSTMIHREKNLVLSANVFKWIEFSLERDKKEYEAIREARKDTEKEIEELLSKVLAMAEAASDHYFRGAIYSAIAEIYCSKYLADQLDLMEGGKTRSKIGNLYFVRRWNLGIFLYDRESQKKIKDSWRKCVLYFEKSISEYRAGGKTSEGAHATYNLAVKYKITYRFRRASDLLAQAKILAEQQKETRLLQKIALLEKEVEDKNKHMRNYVEEMGLDLP